MEVKGQSRFPRILHRPRMEKPLLHVAQQNIKFEECIRLERTHRVQLPPVKGPHMVYDCTDPTGPLYHAKKTQAKGQASRTSWMKIVNTPGPGLYNIERGFKHTVSRAPMFPIIGVRRPKRHDLGPFTTL
ncbi:protein STPG3 [Spea bombifrons]|uniref:protein STPG3 n=1 Tax=Spea bombifrons TaxID=233779 RepID=UPI00234BD9E7|nr:protein STPG3 [Spea bombifrons]